MKHLNAFEKEIYNYLGKSNYKKIQSYKVGIAGAGGLGSNCAFNLVRSGFKRLLLVDYDNIEYSNLNRQFYFYNQVGASKVKLLKENLLRINPDLEIETINKKVSKDNIEMIFRDCQVVIEAFDNLASKKMIVEEYLNSTKLLVAASGLAAWGKSDQIIIKKVKNNSYIVGDFISEVSETAPAFSPRVNIVAAKQADIVLNYVLEVND